MIGGGLRSHERTVTVDPGIEELEYIQYYIKTTSARYARPLSRAYQSASYGHSR